jgi:hypothetical protein
MITYQPQTNMIAKQTVLLRISRIATFTIVRNYNKMDCIKFFLELTTEKLFFKNSAADPL